MEIDAETQSQELDIDEGILKKKGKKRIVVARDEKDITKKPHRIN